MGGSTLNPPNGHAVYPLTVVSWSMFSINGETAVSGTIRNDSGYTLSDIRVVCMAGVCKAKEATPATNILDTGKKVTFLFTKFYCPTLSYTGLSEQDPLVEISAQGVRAP